MAKLADSASRSNKPQALWLLAPVALLACGGEQWALSSGSAGLVGGKPHSGHPSVGKLVQVGGGAMCTATLVGDRTVLTAAHCIKTSRQQFIVGGRTYEVVAKHRHPDYVPDSTVIEHDVGLVRLAAAPEVLPSTISTRKPTLGATVTMVGYGRTGEEESDSGVKRIASHRIDKITPIELHFYGHAAGNGNVCNGDSGGPSFATIAGDEVQVGIHSSTIGGCGVEGQDARVDAFVGWITQVADGDVYKDGALPRRDSAPPRVSIISPTNHARTGTSVTVSANISDDTAISRATLLVNGRELVDLARPPFDFRITALPAGVATVLTVIAEDEAGNRAFATVTVTPTPQAAPVPDPDPLSAEAGSPPGRPLALGGCAVAQPEAPTGSAMLLALLLGLGLRRRRR